MPRFRAVLHRLWGLIRKSEREAEMAEELRAHLDGLTERNLAAGMTPEEARYAALRSFGGVAQIAERCREQRGSGWLEHLGKDMRFALRSLVRARGFTIVAVATLALGIGVATVVFDLTAWILVFSQPFPHSQQLYAIGYKDGRTQFASYRTGFQFQAYQEQTNVFTEFAAVNRTVSNVVVDGDPTAADVARVSRDCFHTLGIRPVLGRGFLPEEYQAGPDQVVILSDLFWRRHFQADPAVLGQTVLIDQHDCKVIGILAAPKLGGLTADIYRPLILPIASARVDDAKVFDWVLYIIGRLRPGVTPAQACAALAAVKLPTLPQWAAAFFSGQQPALVQVTDLTDPGSYWVMLVAAGLLFIIASLNAMNLMLVRLLGRGRELSIRLALGATRWRIARLLIMESMAIALAAWSLVALSALWLFPIIVASISGNAGVRYQSHWDWKSLGCLSGLSLVATLTVAAVPLLRLSKIDLSSGLKSGGSAVGESRNTGRARSALVILQAALAVVLLTGTGLLMRTFEKLHQVDLGFDPTGKVKVHVAFPRGFTPKPKAELQYFDRLQQRLSTLPGVKGVAYGTDALLIGGFYGTAQLKMADGTFRPTAGAYASDDYLRTAGLILEKGRWLSGKQRHWEVVINQALAKARFGDKNPIGQIIQLQVSGNQPYEVVGVLRDVRETVRSAAGLCIYQPIWMYPPNSNTLVLRLDHDPGPGFAGLVRRALYQFDPKLIATDVSSVNEAVDNSMQAERYAFTILRALSGIALVLAVVGLFSVIAYTVDTRMKEFGVRLALGAKPANLHQLVLQRGLAVAAIGVSAGTAGALGVTRFMRSLLFETAPYDPWVYAAVALILLAAAAAACWLPARRAARVDISRLLRVE